MESLDTEWVDEFERREAESELTSQADIDTIRTHVIRIGAGREVEGVSSDDLRLADTNRISKEELIGAAMKHRTHNGVKYRLMAVACYNVALNDDTVSSFVESSGDDPDFDFLTCRESIDDIVLSPTVHLLHDLNALFLFFRPPPGVTQTCTRRVRIGRKLGRKTRCKRV